MKAESLGFYGLSAIRLAALSAAASALAALSAGFVLNPALGPATIEVQILVFCIVAYVVASIPRRALDLERLVQARESVMLSAAAAALLVGTGSKAKTFLALRSDVPSIESALESARRGILLGAGVEVAANRASRKIASPSVSNVISRISAFGTDSVSIEGEEVRGLRSSAALRRETKLPVFMTTCFFLPIITILYAEFSHLGTLVGMISLISLEVLILDFAFYLCSADRMSR
jgi:hypothetical protein